MIYCAIELWHSNDNISFKISIKAILLVFDMILGFAAPFQENDDLCLYSTCFLKIDWKLLQA